ncbi:sensor histidine kinase [Halobacteriales archaeon QS_4_69_34]|nr:MAG: sensor histidine kinase [Halobacteriales archaeon QS_4_69_34]
MRTEAQWSIEAVGVSLSVLSVVHYVFDPNRGIEGYREIVLPLLISGGIIVFGRMLYHRSIAVETRERSLIAFGFLGGGALFCPILIWSLDVATADGAVSMEATTAILINAASLGMVSGGFIATGFARLRRQRDRLREKTARLEKLASIVSHDLRNPLTIARGRIELAQETGETDHLGAVADAVDRMEIIIEDMTNLVREVHSVDATTVVALDTVADTAWEIVETDDVELQIKQSMRVEANKSTLRHVFENLFRNAVEHGGETVRTVRVGRLDSQGFYVEDDGRGVSDEAQNSAFEWGTTGDDGGAGLGLAIVHEIISAHGWEMTITASSQGGARFEITGIEPWDD